MITRSCFIISIFTTFLLTSCHKDTNPSPSTVPTPAKLNPVSLQTIFETRFGGSYHYQAWSGNTMRQTSDGGYILLGTIYDGTSDNIYLVKTDAMGNKLWDKQLGGKYRELAGAVRETADKGYVLIGTITLSDDWTNQYIYLAKVSQNGVVEWEKHYGDGYLNNGWAIEQSTDGGFITLNEHDFKTLLLKVDARGDSLMSSTLPDVNISFSKGRDILTTQAGGCVFIGDKDGVSSIIKTNHTLQEEWSRRVNTAAYPNAIDACAIQAAQGGGYIVLGKSTNSNKSDYYLLKLDDQGDERWHKLIDYGNGDFGKSIVATQEGGYVFLGHSGKEFDNNIMIVKLDGEGNNEWNKSFPAGEYSQARAIVQNREGDFVLLKGELNTSSRLMEMILVKLKPVH